MGLRELVRKESQGVRGLDLFDEAANLLVCFRFGDSLLCLESD